jgi:hypothetical protein
MDIEASVKIVKKNIKRKIPKELKNIGKIDMNK